MSNNSKRIHKARRARTRIAQTFAALDNDQLSATDVLERPPDALGRIRVYDVLRRIPHLNRDGAENVCRRAKVWPLKRMDALTPEERQRLIIALPPRVKR
jgi:hypothetical protein